MFTGIIEEIGILKSMTQDEVTVQAEKILSDLKLGDSVAVNGCCLTVTNIKDKKAYYDHLKSIINDDYYLQDLDEYDSLLEGLEEDLDYKKMMEIDNELKKLTPNSGFVSILDEFKSNSLLINGFGKMLMHTHFAEHGLKAITKMSLTGHRINVIRSTLELLYLNKDKEESANSRVIRYYLLSKGGEEN